MVCRRDGAELPMMRMQMRIQKNQIPGGAALQLVYSGAQSNTFDKTPYVMAGYENFDILIVGAAGGASGAAYGNTSSSIKMSGSGGGGGGSLRLQGKLNTLPILSPIVVGGPGSVGADSGIRSKAGNGGGGGYSAFGSYNAYGGGGGIGADWDLIDFGGGDTYVKIGIRGQGGVGGGNGLGVGAGGVGAVCSDASIYTGSSFGASAPGDGGSPATLGTYVAAGSFPIIGGGHGGGGGKGQLLGDTAFTQAPTNGAWGNTTQATGIGSNTVFNIGGTGGGADISLVLGGAYRGYGGGIVAPNSGGCVAISIS